MDDRARRHAERRTDLIAWIVVIAVVGVLAAGLGFGLDALMRAPWPAVADDERPAAVIAPPAPPPPATKDDLGRAVRRTAWAVPPAPIYPPYAVSKGVDAARVELACEALAEGRVGACRTVSEEPAGYGFAAAAAASLRDARLHPAQIEGSAVDSSIRFTVRFQLEEEAAPPRGPGTPPPA